MKTQTVLNTLAENVASSNQHFYYTKVIVFKDTKHMLHIQEQNHDKKEF